MSDRDPPYIIVEKGSGSGLGAFVIGALLGAGAALLLAPKSGEETQAELKAQADKWRQIAGEKVRDAQTVLEDRIDVVREGVEGRMDSVRDAMDAGRQAARDARVQLEDRIERSKAAYKAGIEAAKEAAADGQAEPAAEA